MKTISAVVVAATVACTMVSTNAQTGNETSLSGSNDGEVSVVSVDTVNRTDIPVGAKTYFTGLSSTEDGPNPCAGALITPTHVLTSSGCIMHDIRWASVGARHYNGTEDVSVEKIKIVAMITHPEFEDLSNDLMIVELERPSSHQPVALVASDGSDFKAGEWGDIIGWKWIVTNDSTSSTRSETLQSGKVRIMSNEECSTMMDIDYTMVCSGGLANEDPCQGVVGSPLIVKRSSGNQSSHDVIVSVVSWGNKCHEANNPVVNARVSTARSWIDTISSNGCFA